MSNAPHHRPPDPVDPTAPQAPERWVWIAAAAILVMAVVGLYRGFSGIQAAQGAFLVSPKPGVFAPVDATAAAPLAHDDQWSTLSGPKVLPPAPPKAAPPPADDAQDDSSAPDQADAATAEAPPPEAPPPAAVAAPPPTPANPAPAAPPQPDGTY